MSKVYLSIITESLLCACIYHEGAIQHLCLRFYKTGVGYMCIPYVMGVQVPSSMFHRTIAQCACRYLEYHDQCHC